MRVNRISVSNFRNIESLNFYPSERFNLFYGLNGEGKTNIIESIYLLGNPKSFRSCKFNDLIQRDSEQAVIRGVVEAKSSSNIITTLIEKDGRRVAIDGKAVTKASELHGRIISVIYSPEDTMMLKGAPELRRKFIDRAVYTTSLPYLVHWHNFRKIVKHRNNLLKEKKRQDISIWNEQFAEAASDIVIERFRYIEKLKPIIQKYYSILSSNADKIEIRYNLYALDNNGDDKQALKNQILNLLEANIDRDEANGCSSIGPHRDDILFFINGDMVKNRASQGELKTFVLALKMSEIENLKSIFKDSPILLLDDISSELDDNRKKNLIDFVTSEDMQVFITSTEKNSFYRNFAKSSICKITDGKLNIEEKCD